MSHMVHIFVLVGPIEKIPKQVNLYRHTNSSIKISGWSGVRLSVRFPVFALLIDFLQYHSSEKDFQACFKYMGLCLFKTNHFLECHFGREVVFQSVGWMGLIFCGSHPRIALAWLPPTVKPSLVFALPPPQKLKS